MAHGGKQEGDLLLVMAHIGRLVMKLSHQHTVARRVSGGETRKIWCQLIAEDEDQVANARHQKSASRCVSRDTLRPSHCHGPRPETTRQIATRPGGRRDGPPRACVGAGPTRDLSSCPSLLLSLSLPPCLYPSSIICPLI